jgi:hypothetical protein
MLMEASDDCRSTDRHYIRPPFGVADDRVGASRDTGRAARSRRRAPVRTASLRVLLTLRVLGVAAAAAVLLLGAVAAQASDATTIADRAGFLLGHAHRCGVPDGRLERSAVLIDHLLAAYSADDDDLQSARSEFAEHIVTGAMAKLLGDPLPACAAVRAQLSRLEQHQLAAAHPGNPGSQPIADKLAGGSPHPARNAAGAVTVKRAAAELHSRPPSL